jgi:hypothetical protein
VIWAYDGGGRYSQQQTFDVIVGAKADMPVITLAKAGVALDGRGTFNGGSTIPVNVSVNFSDTDGSGDANHPDYWGSRRTVAQQGHI